MSKPSKKVFEKYFREERFPSIFCKGCGAGNIMHFSGQALYEAGIEPRELVVFSGIGCCGRIPGYFKVDAAHTTHGRALAFATGAKIANPELNILVFSGDGDTGAIGGNHLIQACRRNIDLTLIIINNRIYGMTGGQAAPTTPQGAKSTTSPYGNIEPPLDLSSLASSAGGTYVAKWSTAHPRECIKSIRKGLENEGFSCIEILSPCPTGYGKRNKELLKDTYEIFENLPVLSRASPMSKDEYEKEKQKNEYGWVLGILEDKEEPEFSKKVEDLSKQIAKS
ncbi:hypothetical protein AKJ39_03040 [candidate division MSBL1 archaeon SCGC-AAA259J03]|uniref:Thiamine pyrophosphate enzyme TPP-binding domain-containing protein n=1 Tax=candidate division MSBL1 archaeon SCGC-AAA259J03 TaxID=1698269 RepID=A0A656YVT6_9EURY|nr:hypothetical protein AKJ39_03040 [candidate division MSBL1 archaeon SCGC-AAA259J03]